ncbi:MAG: hypothetical protein AAGI03_02005 [Pseudomonadota bacterium]
MAKQAKTDGKRAVLRITPEQATQREVAETIRIETTMDRGRRPESVSSEIISVAPGQGPLIAAPMVEVMTDSTGQMRIVSTGYRGKVTARVSDVWDRMAAQATRAGGATRFTMAEVETARHYATLTEAVASGCVKCSSFERGSSGGSAGAMDAFIRDCEKLRSYHARIGKAVQLQVRRIRPSERRTRWDISDRVLVDQVCLGGMTLSDVLRGHGWSVSGAARAAAAQVLSTTLLRMA